MKKNFGFIPIRRKPTDDEIRAQKRELSAIAAQSTVEPTKLPPGHAVNSHINWTTLFRSKPPTGAP